jgi:electron transport complex protein RnfA
MEHLGGLLAIAFTAALINNFVFHYFVGICPFLGVSRKLDLAAGMGLAVTFVLAVASTLSWFFTFFILRPEAPWPTAILHWVAPEAGLKADLSILSYLTYILVIAASVQFVEMYLRKMFPALHRSFGLFLPLITTNCAILFACLEIMKNVASAAEPSLVWGLDQALSLALGGGLGFTLAMVLMAGIREELELADGPKPFEGTGISLIVAGMLAMAFTGFTGMDKGLAEKLGGKREAAEVQVAPPAQDKPAAQPPVSQDGRAREE